MKAFYLTLFFIFFLTTAAFAVININTATQSELTALPGIGPVKAEAIVQYRKDNGPFKEINALKNVNGIGVKTVEKIKKDITVGAITKTTVEKKTTKDKQADAKAPEKK
ncbi:MAG: helix-hairpin-helix domain-containing protein [Candidatus Electrothrix sp. AR4]|nr:helix-hairpin-helix domain-containing protein [Candidatus Electrothrix sp. AR4]